jgi:hypothetical protein
MEETVTYLALVAGSDPEQFALITENTCKGVLKHMAFMSEDEFRATFQKAGVLDAEITSKVFHARQDPR